MLLCWYWNSYKHNRIVQISRPRLNYIIILGAILFYLTMILLAIPTSNKSVFVGLLKTIPWTMALGFSLCYGTIIMKMLRVYYIVSNPLPNKVSVARSWCHTGSKPEPFLSYITEYQGLGIDTWNYFICNDWSHHLTSEHNYWWNIGTLKSFACTKQREPTYSDRSEATCTDVCVKTFQPKPYYGWSVRGWKVCIFRSGKKKWKTAPDCLFHVTAISIKMSKYT